MAVKQNNIKYNQLDVFWNSAREDNIPPVILIYGESFLVDQVLKEVCSFFTEKGKNPFAVETLAGENVSVGEIIEQVSTFSFFVSQKIVAVKNIPLFQPAQNNQNTGFTPSDLDHFILFVETGIPLNHFLILTCANINKNKKIYKTIAQKGLVIDCSVAIGERKSDISEQRSVLQGIAEKTLVGSQKKIDNPALNRLVELTGFSPELFARNIEKLISYVGEKNRISIEDVQAVITRDKKDPIFNFTNAFIEKNFNKTLFYLHSLLNEGFHPLQILKALENQTRKLLMAKCFVREFYKTTSSKTTPLNLKNINFNMFKQKVLPAVIRHDGQTKATIENWDENLSQMDTKKKKKDIPRDLLLAPNPKSPYPVFLMFQKTENFSLAELNDALFFLSDLDYLMKSSSFDVIINIENFIMQICSKGGFVYAQENKNRRHHI